MGTLQKLKAFRDFIRCLPGVNTAKDYDLVVEIGYHQLEGKPVTLKQLLHLDIAAPATIRRHLAKLIKDGKVIQHKVQSDHRAVQYLLSDDTLRDLINCAARL